MKKVKWFNWKVIFLCLLFSLRFSFAQEEESTTTTSVSDIFSLLSDEGKILYGDEPNSIMVIDYPQNVKKIEKYLEMVDSPAEQVLIDARVVEVTLTDDTALGINWQMFKEFEIGEMHVNPLEQQIPYKGTEEAGTFTVTVFNKNVQFVLNTLAQYVKTDLLSAPKITTLNGKSAKIDVVQEVPWVEITVEMATEAGENDVITYEVNKEEVGITLEVTPTISPDGSITLKLEPEVSEVVDWYSVPVITSQGQLEYEVPVIDTRKAETTVRINNGQTLIIGGMIKDKLTNSYDKIPLFGDIPLLGHFFKSSRVLKEKTELLIFVSPTIITPAELKKMAREERYGLGRRHTMERETKEKYLLKEEKAEEGKKLWEKVKDLYQEGKQAYDQNHYGKAMYYFQKVLEIYPQHKLANEYMNKIHKKLKELEQRERLQSLYQEGERLYLEGKYQQAIDKFQQALKIQPDYEEAIQYLQKVEKKVKQEEEFNNLYQEGKKLIAKKEYEKAIQKFSEALKIRPDNKEIEKEMLKAIKELKVAQKKIELEKKIQNLYREGLVFYKKREYEKAMSCFKEITSIAPGQKRAVKLTEICEDKIEQQKRIARRRKIEEMIKRGKEYIRNREYDLALDSFSNILKIEPENRKAKSYIKEVKRRVQIIKERESKRLIQELARKQEEEIKVLLREAKLLSQKGDLETAKSMLEEILKIRENKQAKKLLDQIDEKLTQKSVSEKVPQAELKAKYDAGLNAFKRGDYQQALSLFRELNKISPKNKKITHYIEICQDEIKKEEEKRWLESRYNQAVNLFKLAFYDKAIEFFKDIEKQSPGYKDISEYLKQAYQRKKLLVELGEYEQSELGQ